MTVSTFYPDGHPESTSVDGIVTIEIGAGADWSVIRATSTGGSATDGGSTFAIVIQCDAAENKWDLFRRGFFLFDTSALGAGATISSATFGLVITAKTDDFSDSISMVTTTPASNTELVVGDFNQIGTTKQATDLTLAGLTADSATFNSFTLNSTGLGNISLTGISKFGVRMTSDNDDSEPTYVQNDVGHIQVAAAEETLSGDKRPKLVVTYTLAFTPKVMMF